MAAGLQTRRTWIRVATLPATLDPADCLLPRQLPVLDPVRLIGFGAEPALAIGFVVLVVALEPHHLAVAFERQDVRRDAVEEPAIVADDDGAAGERQQRLFERAQRVDVEVVGRLVEQQQVARRP